MATRRLSITAGERAASDLLLHVLHRARRDPPSLSSDFARKHAPYVAMAASLGFITTRISPAIYGRRWMVTTAGMRHLSESENT